MSAELAWSDWSFAPTVVAGLLALLAAYLAAQRRGLIGAADDTAPWGVARGLRGPLFVAGVGIAFVALTSPIDEGGDTYLFWLHMIQHLLLMMVAPPLALLGICGALRLGTAVPWWLRRGGAFLTGPWAACAVFNAVMLVWHVPAFYDATLRTEWIHIVEHLTFVAAGVIFWWPIIDPLSVTGPRASALTRIAMLAIAGLPPTILGFVFVTAPSALYGFYAQAPRLWGFTPVADQQLGGVLMLGVGNVIYFVAVAVIFIRMFGDPAGDEAAARERSLIPS